MIQPYQLRMARAALNWSLRDLESKSGVGRNTISRFESGYDVLTSSLQGVEKALAEAGIVFFEDNRDYGTGVGLKKRHRK